MLNLQLPNRKIYVIENISLKTIDVQLYLDVLLMGWGVEPRTTPPPSQGVESEGKRERERENEKMTQYSKAKLLLFSFMPHEWGYIGT